MRMTGASPPEAIYTIAVRRIANQRAAILRWLADMLQPIGTSSAILAWRRS